jgi:hypothetical protein
MTSNQPPQTLPKYCILCVDDDHIGRGARAALLEDEGYSVIAVSCPLMAEIGFFFPHSFFQKARRVPRHTDPKVH